MNHTERSGVIVRQQERRTEVGKLRPQGVTLEHIAAQLGTAAVIIDSCYERHDPTEELRRLVHLWQDAPVIGGES